MTVAPRFHEVAMAQMLHYPGIDGQEDREQTDGRWPGSIDPIRAAKARTRRSVRVGRSARRRRMTGSLSCARLRRVSVRAGLGLGTGLVLAWLTLLFPAESQDASQGHVRASNSNQDGGVIGDAAEAASEAPAPVNQSPPDGGLAGDVAKVAAIHVRVSGSTLPGEVVHDAMGPTPTDDANLAEWAAAACQRIVKAYQRFKEPAVHTAAKRVSRAARRRRPPPAGRRCRRGPSRSNLPCRPCRSGRP